MMTPSLLSAPTILGTAAFSFPPSKVGQYPSPSVAVADETVLVMDDRDGIIAEDLLAAPATTSVVSDEQQDTSYFHTYIKKRPTQLMLDFVPKNSLAQRFFAATRHDDPLNETSAPWPAELFRFESLSRAPGFEAVFNMLTPREIQDALGQAEFKTAAMTRYLIEINRFHERFEGEGDLYFLKKALLRNVKDLRRTGALSEEEAKALLAKFKDPGFSIYDIVTAELLLCYALGPFVQHGARLAASLAEGFPGIQVMGEPHLQFPTHPLMWAGYLAGATIISFILGGGSDTFKFAPWVMSPLRFVEDQGGETIGGWARSLKDYIARPRPEIVTPRNLSLEGAIKFAKAKYRYLRLHWGGVAVEQEYPKDFKSELKAVTWVRDKLKWLEQIPGVGSFVKSVADIVPDTAGEGKAYGNNLFITNVLGMVIMAAVQVSVTAATDPNYMATAEGVTRDLGVATLNASMGWLIGCLGNLYITMNSKTSHQAVVLRQFYSVAQTAMILAVFIPELHPALQQALVATGGAAMLYGVTKLMPPKKTAA